MQIGSWDDIRSALTVARLGTVSAAAQALGVHHATVIRRIDALESRLGAKLFQRHPRGYALTEAGQTLLEVAAGADERFSQMAARIAGAGARVEGEIVLTSLPDVTALILPRLTRLLLAQPGLRLRYLTDPRLFRLDTGEAHIAIRAGDRPTEPDYVALPLTSIQMRLYGAPGYVAAAGAVEDIRAHHFVLPGPESRPAPFMRWLGDRVAAPNVIVVSNDSTARLAAIRAGLGLGWLTPDDGDGLVEVMALPEWESRLWLVTHVDLHRSPKVQAVLEALRGIGRERDAAPTNADGGAASTAP